MRSLAVHILCLLCLTVAPAPAYSCEWAWVAVAAISRAFNRPSKFWKDPELVTKGILKEVDGVKCLVLPFKSTEDIRTFPIIGWSEYGNPIIRMEADGRVFVPTQSGIPNYRRYAYKQSNLENVTYAKPIEARVFVGDEKHRPQYAVQDGHHRFYGSYRTEAPAYVEISGFTFFREKTLRWDDLEF